ncbi:MAG: hypothetical protein Fur0018_26550 [Anaerolineales bacterium]
MKQRLKYVLIFAGVVALLFLLSDFNARMAELNRVRQIHRQVSTQLESLEGTQAALQTQVAYATSDAAVIEHAYQDDRMVRPGDVLIVPMVPAAVTPAPTSAVVVTPRAREPWEYWFALFFGQSP